MEHGWDVKDLLVAYRRILQRAIDIIWENTEWKERRVKHDGYETTRLIPVFPSSNEFKRNLRSELLKNWPYAAHYVDSAIKTAYSILSSWRQNYIKGFRRKKKPTVKREFVRVKTTLMKVEGTKIRVTIEPRKRYVELDFSEEWFSERVKGWEVGELIIKEKEVYITFKHEVEFKGRIFIGVDSNLKSLDIYHPERGWIRVDLSELHRIAKTYDRITDALKSLEKRAPKRIRRLLKKYHARRRNRIEDFLNKLAVQLSREFPDAVFVFEDLSKTKMFKEKENDFNRRLSRIAWKKIVQKLSYRAPIKFVDPSYTSSTCPRCGSRLKSQNGQVECPSCGLLADRQFIGAYNIWMRGSGVALSGDKANDMLPDEPGGGLRLMSPKSVVSVNLSGRLFVHKCS